MNQKQALLVMQSLRGAKAYASYSPERTTKEVKLRSGAIRKPKLILQKFEVGYKTACSGIGLLMVDGESNTSWDEAIQKARDEIAREQEHEAKRRKRNKA